MTYRELRNFSEMLRALGYERHVSIENFRTPNFKLVAEILVWLLKRYEPDYDLPMETDTEQDRVIFIKMTSQFLVTLEYKITDYNKYITEIQKARIKVNPKKLYQADGFAVQEMLKVASVLYNAIKENADATPEDEDVFNLQSISSAVNAKLNELRLSRKLATEITEKGASLYDLLNKEVNLREQRSTALARQLELPDIEKSLRLSIKRIEDDIKQTMYNLDNIASDEATLDAKIEKKRADLERQQKRLAQLQTVRPAYLDEQEKLQAELQTVFNLYVQKFRNVTYLESIYSDYDRAEQERALEAEMALKKMAERVREEEREKQAAAEKREAAAMMEADDEDQMSKENQIQTAPKIYGSMTGAGISDDEDQEDEKNGSLKTDDDEDDVVIAGVERAAQAVARVRPTMQQMDNTVAEVQRKAAAPMENNNRIAPPTEHNRQQPPLLLDSDDLSSLSDDQFAAGDAASRRRTVAVPTSENRSADVENDSDDNF